MPNTDEYLAQLPSWQRANLDVFRKLVHASAPNVPEGLKWGVPVFMVNGKTIFAMAAFKEHTKYNFMANGAKLSDPAKLFNNSLESKRSRNIDLREGETIDQGKLAALITESLESL